jgi:molecular chaperone DnaJ
MVYRASMEDVIKGKKIEVDFVRHITCGKCQGEGCIEKEEQCDVCKGQGMLNSLNGNVYFSMTCGECGGSGKKMEKCKDCEGKGSASVSEKANVNIPAGIGPLSALKMTGKGNTVYFNGQKTTGDTYIIIDYPQKERGVLLMNGDIHSSIVVPFNTVMSEKEIKVDILGCKEVTLKLDSSKKTGHQYKIEHQGVTDKNNAFIKVFLDLPKNKIDGGSKKKIIDLMEEIYGSPTLQFNPATTFDS